jgi:hypothetical protein
MEDAAMTAENRFNPLDKDEPRAVELAALKLTAGLARLMVRKGLISRDEFAAMVAEVVEDTRVLPFQAAKWAAEFIDGLENSPEFSRD